MKQFDETKKVLPYHIQFFADPNPNPPSETDPASTPAAAPAPDPASAPASDGKSGNEQEPPKPVEPQLTPEEQLTRLMAEQKKMKVAFDKAASDAAEWKRKYHATLDDKTRLDLEKAEREAAFQAEFDALKKENTINKMSKSFIGMGYTEEQAIKAATAQVEGDTDELFRIQQAFLTARDKQREAEWMKTHAVAPAGGAKTETEDAFIRGFDKG